jgi:hypothetical protein
MSSPAVMQSVVCTEVLANGEGVHILQYVLIRSCRMIQSKS